MAPRPKFNLDRGANLISSLPRQLESMTQSRPASRGVLCLFPLEKPYVFFPSPKQALFDL